MTISYEAAAPEVQQAREQLYGMTQQLIADTPEDASVEFLNEIIERCTRNLKLVAATAERAGGRWLVHATGELVFTPGAEQASALDTEGRDTARQH